MSLIIFLLLPLAGSGQGELAEVVDLVHRSCPTAKVSDFLFADIDADGQDELAVVLWKRGYYGPSLPFWETENIDDYGQHLYIYELEPAARLKWGSSTIKNRIRSLDFQDENLVINQVEKWQWQEFGFERS